LWHKEIRRELLDSVAIQRYLFRNHARVDRAVRGGKDFPWLAEAIIDYAIGRRSYGDVRRRVFLRAPGAALRLAWRTMIDGRMSRAPAAT
jgi:hypothetical protein